MKKRIITPDSDKKDCNGKWRTKSLFWEHRRDGYPYFWTLKDTGTEELPSLREIYLSYSHVPGHEYDFAMEVIGSWKHWLLLCEGTIKEHVQEWRDELEIKNKANALKRVILTAKAGEGAASLNAAKYLADKGYETKRGRPSKEEKARALKQDSMVKDEIEEDLARVGLKLIQNK